MLSEDQSYTRLDTAFACFFSQRAKLDASQKPVFEALLKRLSFQQNQGHNCIAINPEEYDLLLASGFADGSGHLPLVIENDRFYLQRYWHYENRLAEQIKAMLTATMPEVRLDDSTLDRYFPAVEAGIDWQREAAKIAVKQSFCIITGGPGTGKTTTVVKILALLQELVLKPLSIALAAPTGKAAMRLQESIINNKAQLPCAESVKNVIPESVTTLHRLLGAKPPSPYFLHNNQQPLVYDVVVVDEASMVDLALMSKLMDALKPSARLILLGDKEQLASVESGAVLADLTAALPGQTLELKTSYRFGGTIKKLADAINREQAEEAWQILQTADSGCGLLTIDPVDYIAEQQLEYLQMIKAEADYAAIFSAHARFQVLCANRQGYFSVADINHHVEQKLAAQKRITLSGFWYVGRPVMVTENNPALQLYNGDIGICLADKGQNNQLMVFFQRADGVIKKYLPARLPLCETVFAMTIHKSQGSEFDEVLIVLPNTINPILTKELLYTAITRAKKSVKLVASESVFKQTVRQKIIRVTGLVNKF